MALMILRANIIHAERMGALSILERGYLVCEDGVVQGVFATLPAPYAGAEVEDLGDKILIPAFCDMHLHAPQYAMLGLGMDMQLLSWLNTYTFPTEAAFADAEYAREVYRHFSEALVRLGTTRVCAFATIHRESTHILMQELSRAGITGYVGKVNMDRNSPREYCEDTQDSIGETERFIEECEGRYPGIKPILTPRFTPSCTDALLAALGVLSKKKGLRVQSHLSENLEEVAWVRALCPDIQHYHESYLRAGLFQEYTLMAHCVHIGEAERAAMREHGVWAVHCPDSNLNLASGIAPVRRMLQEGVQVALGSDIAGGARLSMMETAVTAIRASKLRWLQSGKEEPFLSMAEAFYMATSAGARYFHGGPGFQKGDKLHGLVLDDSMLLHSHRHTLSERLERILYLAPVESIVRRYGEGRRIG